MKQLAATEKSFAVFDGDSHVVEPAELWQKYLDPEYRAVGKTALWREEGKLSSYLKINGEVFRDIDNSNIPRHAIWRPGMTWDAIGALDVSARHPMNEGAWNPEVRLHDMDAMGVDQAVLYPTWFAEGFPLVKDPDVAYALARAYNDWITDFCKADHNRLFATAILPLQNMDFAIEELRRIAKIRCFRGAFIRPMFVEGRYFTHSYYEPLWEELAKLEMPAAVHATPGLNNPEWTSHGPFIEKVKNRLGQTNIRGNAGAGPFAGGGGQAFTVMGMSIGHSLSPILAYWLDSYLFVAATLLGYGVMNRYPTMKVVLAHGKATWMEEVLEKVAASSRVIALQHYYPVRTDAEEMWRDGRVMLGFDAEERGIRKLPERYAAKVIWGSRYPHDDTTSAWDAIELLRQANVDEAFIEQMLGGNAARQFDIELTQFVGL
jgi:predicted TIM-barrel fold metal-dependent hydrolase